jgi:hypothetical protein
MLRRQSKLANPVARTDFGEHRKDQPEESDLFVVLRGDASIGRTDRADGAVVRRVTGPDRLEQILHV